AFITWLLGHFLLALNLRSEREPLLRLGVGSNPLMLIWGAATVAFALLATLVPGVRDALKTMPLSSREWLLCIAVAFAGTCWQDAVFGGGLVANAAVGIFQELRAKRALDRLAVLTAPRARLIRDGEVREVAVAEVVLDDLLEVAPGDQVVVDGVVVASQGLEIDASLLTGEADPQVKEAGDELLSGSVVAAGTGRYRATRVGADADARALARAAR